MRVLVVAILVACGDPRATTTASTRDAAPIATPNVPVRVTVSQSIRWDHVTTTPDCFYFSGPEGRDDSLVGTAEIERSDTHVRVTINNATFEGTYREGTLDLVRISPHQYDGAWLVLETLHGSVRDGAMTAHYRYTECDAEHECPGRCALSGDVTFRAIR